MDGPSIERTLHDLFAGRATPLQKKTVEVWLRTPENQELYYQCLARYEADHSQYIPDLTTSLADYQSFMKGGTYPRHGTAAPIRPLPVRQSPRWLLSIAASLLLLLGVGYVTYDWWGYESLTAPYGQTRTFTLADGSDVTLNAHSVLRVPRFGFGNADRDVWMTGEGYFNVRHTVNDHRFTVHTSNLDIHVLGTKFNVDARAGQTEVVLSEGKVELVEANAADKHSLTMKPGDQVTLMKGDTAFRRKLTLRPDQVAAYRQNQLVFTDTPLSQVAQRIEEYYGIRVVVPNRELARRELTGTLPNNDLTVVLRTLSLSYNLAVDRRPNQVILKPQ
ncbi:FecR family protein [Fibrella forsythiae]|uniref:FecR domain-containing protein n=1 Tax=Fibrella forsythiae TaxID=2817061 RepID=A0ABS3JNU8_9BACT|nr:FecR domain-containing protein [Fibrella forsythiae]MBO0951091.1 FecR domain-containing protein [Fibrella forsythiae]